MVACPICSKNVALSEINDHLDVCSDIPPVQEAFKLTAKTELSQELFVSVSGSSQEADISGVIDVDAESECAFDEIKIESAFAKPGLNPMLGLRPQSGKLGAATKQRSHILASGVKIKRAPTYTYTPQPKKLKTEEETEETVMVLPILTETSEPLPDIDDKVRLLKQKAHLPLAERLRPTKLSDYVGQQHLIGVEGVLQSFIVTNRLPSLILWGPPGSGKTTLARIICRTINSRCLEVSATNTSTGEMRKMFEDAVNEWKLTKRRTVIFIDEIHRFNKAQQDVLLPVVERGSITLIGATTENPSFQINNALLSRCRVFVLKKLSREEVSKVINRGLILINQTRKLVFGNNHLLRLAKESIDYLADLSDGDSRTALNLLDIIDAQYMHASSGQQDTGSERVIDDLIDPDHLQTILKKTHMNYDRVGDAHYDTISAFHKSVRGGDPDATLFYLAKMLRGGEDPIYIARRMIRIASEDVGVADESCLPFAVAAYQSVQMVGLPEANVCLAHCAVKLARAEKSVELYRAWKLLNLQLDSDLKIQNAVIPVHLRNAPTKLMKDLEYGKEYKYPPNFKDGRVKQDYLPDEAKGYVWLNGKHLGDEVDPDL
ncbi:hypothetical protein BABINDRAFT_7562 [Babjeviella inositovora NRRL Y-12698]|uniref:UBZ4-type domain-containing protein n=1 Tax=Babjeviella inositovora NRRL Y-12698 TaxID=984486 RepID=A0A1E3QTL5_9ASCO|nr:uncharacterized protein BABINDRAFT_7562 [Babjeviella inositovora NRRL Y-12698]ODQ80884.1 hypothetical protein BABINDRAFT_7562 [Babjeviella inositovora NRRL Y-12698]